MGSGDMRGGSHLNGREVRHGLANGLEQIGLGGNLTHDLVIAVVKRFDQPGEVMFSRREKLALGHVAQITAQQPSGRLGPVAAQGNQPPSLGLVQ